MKKILVIFFLLPLCLKMLAQPHIQISRGTDTTVVNIEEVRFAYPISGGSAMVTDRFANILCDQNTATLIANSCGYLIEVTSAIKQGTLNAGQEFVISLSFITKIQKAATAGNTLILTKDPRIRIEVSEDFDDLSEIITACTQSLGGGGGGGDITGDAGGDLDGTYPDPEVVRFATIPIDTDPPSNGDVWRFNAVSGQWEHSPPAGDGDSNPNNENQVVTAGTGITVAKTGENYTVTNSAPNVNQVVAAGTGISVSQVGQTFTITNTALGSGADTSIYSMNGSIPASTERAVTIPRTSSIDFQVPVITNDPSIGPLQMWPIQITGNVDEPFAEDLSSSIGIQINMNDEYVQMSMQENGIDNTGYFQIYTTGEANLVADRLIGISSSKGVTVTTADSIKLTASTNLILKATGDIKINAAATPLPVDNAPDGILVLSKAGYDTLEYITPANLAALMGASGAGANFFNGNRTATGSWTHTGAGFNVNLTGYGNIGFNSTNFTAAAGTVLLAASEINLQSSGLNTVDHSLVKQNPAVNGTLEATPYAFLPIDPTAPDDGMYIRWDNSNNQFILDTPAGGGADNWGTQEVEHGSTLTGDGTIGVPLDVAPGGITAVEIGTGAVGAAEILDESITASDIDTGAVTTLEILNETIAAVDIDTGAVATSEILNATILLEDIGQNGATPNEVITWNGSAWIDTSFTTTLSIGSFQTSGNANGLSLSGTTLRAHRATATTPGMVTVDTQTIAGQKTIISADTSQLVLKSYGTGQLGIDFYDIDTGLKQARISATAIGGKGTMNVQLLNSLSGGFTRTLQMDQDKIQFYPGTRTGTFENASLTNETYVINTTPGSLVATHSFQYVSNASNSAWSLPTSGTGAGDGTRMTVWNASVDAIVTTINPGAGETINGSGTGVILNMRGEFVSFHKVGVDWRIVGLRN